MKRITPLPRKFRFQLWNPSHTWVFEILLSFRSVDVKLVRTTLSCFYTQSSSRTLAPPVLPQLLARDWLSFFSKYRRNSFLVKEVYSQSTFIPHATLLDQAFTHCPIFPTAGSEEPRPCFSSGVAILPLRWLRIFDLVSCYPTNISNPQ